MEISRRHLWKANYINILRLAKSLDIIATDCHCVKCKEKIIEQLVRKL